MKNLLLVLCASAIICAHGQSTSLPDPKPYFSAIIVSDVENSIEWYSKNLGFEVLNRVDMSDRGFKQANLKRGSALVELIELNTAISQAELLQNRPQRSRIQGFFKFGFTVSELDSWVEFLTESGVQFNGSVVEDPNSGQRMVIVLDPDGNRIQLFEG